ncbi:hypothetical protein [Lentzea albidocapillata]|uniref:Uncharacterized protein n=1 Tax=Lentzea albidocapillata TaxID=40571 RepID=A0A1W2DUW5_9PSEU|nr:hypothetical protein [Lentzea albidocapillata]SMD01229.1 hypothetical protein SAMN05660733_03301 [Lentzea albidocapillata]
MLGGGAGTEDDAGGGVALVLDAGGGSDVVLVGAGELLPGLDDGGGSVLDGGCSASTATIATAASG